MAHAERKSDAFPETRRTWMGERVTRGELAAAQRHVMEVYERPLRVYCAGCSLGWVGDPGDLVAGFFADRLARPAFFERWRESQRPLRFWLIVSFKHYLFEQARRTKRDRRELGDETDQADASGATPDLVFERECAIGLVRRALRDVEARCRADGYGDHFDVFVRFHMHGESLEAIAERLGIEPARAGVMKRTVVQRFQRVMREVVSWNGASDAELDAEIRGLRETL